MIKIIAETKAQMDELIASRLALIKGEFSTNEEIGNKLGICKSYVGYMLKKRYIPYNNIGLIKTILELAGEDISKYRVWVSDERGKLLCSVDLFPEKSDIKTKLMMEWRYAYDHERFPPGISKENVSSTSCANWNDFKKAVFRGTKPTMRTINSLYRAMGYHLLVVIY